MSSRVLSRGFVHDTFNSLLTLCLPPRRLLGSTRYFSFLSRPVNASLSPCLGETLFLRPSLSSLIPLSYSLPSSSRPLFFVHFCPLNLLHRFLLSRAPLYHFVYPVLYHYHRLSSEARFLNPPSD